MALRKRKECGNDVSTMATACPKCGAVLKKKSGCLSVIVLLFLVFVAIGVVSTLTDRSSASLTTPAASPSQKPTQTASSQPARPKLEVLDCDWATGEFGNRTIRGTVRNNTEKQYGYVQVEINLYDNSGTQVGSTLANVNNLEPNSTWRFEAAVLEDSATKAKVKDVTGF